MKKLKNEIVTDVLDTSTGELIKTTVQKTFSVKVEQDSFFMVYVKYLSAFYSLKYMDDAKVLTKFCEICQFDTGIVYLSSALRRELETELNILSSNFSRSLKRLKEKGLITGEKGKFVINPELYWKGNNNTRNQILKEKALKLEIEFKTI
jgi:hypothetical protein